MPTTAPIAATPMPEPLNRGRAGGFHLDNITDQPFYLSGESSRVARREVASRAGAGGVSDARRLTRNRIRRVHQVHHVSDHRCDYVGQERIMGAPQNDGVDSGIQQRLEVVSNRFACAVRPLLFDRSSPAGAR